MACYLFGAKPLCEPMLIYCKLDTIGTTLSELSFEIQSFSSKEMLFKVPPAKWQAFCRGLNVLTGQHHFIMTNSLIVRRWNTYQAKFRFIDSLTDERQNKTGTICGNELYYRNNMHNVLTIWKYHSEHVTFGCVRIRIRTSTDNSTGSWQLAVGRPWSKGIMLC